MHRTTTYGLAALAALIGVTGACGGDDDATDVAVGPPPTAAPASATRATSTPDSASPDPAAPGTATPATVAPGTRAPATVAAPPSSSPPGPAAGLGSGADWSVVGALAEVPDTGSAQFELVAGDLRQIDTLLGVERPESLAGVDALLDGWLLPLTFPGTPEYRELPLWVALQEPLIPRDARRLGEFDELLGWSVLDVDAFVHYSPEPPGYLLAVSGAFADDALAGLAEVAPGVVTNADGEDFAVDPAAISSVDALGRAVRFARADSRIAVTLATPLAEDWLDRAGPTLADDAHVAEVGEALDAAGVLTAHVFRHDFTGGSTLPITEPFDTVGIGWTIDAGGEPAVIIAYATDADASALAEQVAALFAEGESLATGQPIAEILGDADPDVATDGSVVTVTYQPGERFWWSAVQAVYQRDVLFVHS